MSLSPLHRLRKDWVVRLKAMREAVSSRLSPSSTLAMPLPRGTMEVEPSSLGKFSRVNRNSPSAPAAGSSASRTASTRANVHSRFIDTAPLFMEIQ